jgi:hypothetical protein
MNAERRTQNEELRKLRRHHFFILHSAFCVLHSFTKQPEVQSRFPAGEGVVAEEGADHGKR